MNTNKLESNEYLCEHHRLFIRMTTYREWKKGQKGKVHFWGKKPDKNDIRSVLMYAKANVLFNVHWNNVCCQQTLFSPNMIQLQMSFFVLMTSLSPRFFLGRKHVRIVHWIAFCFHKWNMHSVYALSPIKLNKKMFKFNVIRQTYTLESVIGRCAVFYSLEKRGSSSTDNFTYIHWKGQKVKPTYVQCCVYFTRKIEQWRQWNRNTNENEKKNLPLDTLFLLNFLSSSWFSLGNFIVFVHFFFKNLLNAFERMFLATCALFTFHV